MVVWERGESAMEEGGSFKVWRRVVCVARGGVWGKWTSKLGRGVHGCGLCRDIRMS